MKLKYFFVILLLLCLCGTAYASDVNSTDVYSVDNGDMSVGVEEQVISNELQSIDSDFNENLMTSGGNETLGAGDKIIYFNSSITDEEDAQADGSLEKPFKYLSDDRIEEDSTLFLFSGVYELTSTSYYGAELTNVNIVGQNKEDTFFYSQSQIIFGGNNYISDVTIPGLIPSAVDFYGNLAHVTFDNVISNSLILIGGYFDFFNSLFINGAGYPDEFENTIGGSIYCYYYEGYDLYNSHLNIKNCSFINNTAGYGGVIYMKGGDLIMDNCSFINNTAKYYGGALSCENTLISLTNTSFDNNTASSNAGGALYFVNSNAVIENINITNSIALMGGALTSLNSNITLSNSNFIKNGANYYGGAMYSMFGQVDISNCEFINNTALYGGAIFIDSSENSSIKSKFNNNSALIAGAIYSFKNNGTFDNIYIGNTAVDYPDVYENNMTNLTVYDEGDDYPLFVYKPVEYTTLPEYYNLNDYGWVSPVKNQISDGNCWSFTAMAVLESCILKASNVTYDFSEENMKNIMAFYSDYGWIVQTNQGGTKDMAIGYLTGWLGPVDEFDDPYISSTLLSPLLKSMFHVQNVVFLKRENFTDNDMIKEAILKYGAVGTSMMYNDRYLNTRTNAYYSSISTKTNHAVTIVGWDDNYSKSNFGRNAPAGDGAWIVKNSWGPEWGNDGYFYLSYYDVNSVELGNSNTTYTILLNDTVKYDKNYQYELSCLYYWELVENVTTYYNFYEIEDNELLAAVSTYFNDDYSYVVTISVNGNEKTNQTGTASNGYYTIPLNNFVSLEKGDILKVEFFITNLNNNQAAIPLAYNDDTMRNNIIEYGNSKFLYYGNEFDMAGYDSVSCIKAFTLVKKDANLAVPNMTYTYGENGSVEISNDADNFTVEVIDHSEAVITVSDNTITVSGLNAGNYTLSVTAYGDLYNTETVTSNITVNKAASTLNVDSFSFDYGSSYDVDVEYTNASSVTAFVQNYDEANVVVGDKVITVSGLAAGNYVLNVTTVVDDNHYAVSKTVSFKVNKLNVALTVECENIDYGEKAVVVITLDNDTVRGNIKISLSDIKATVQLDDTFNGTIIYNVDKTLAAGSYKATVDYNGNEGFNSASNSTTFTVSKIDPEIVVNAENILYSQTTKINATLPADATNKLIITVNNHKYVVASGENLAIDNLPIGTYDVEVTYNGDVSYNKVTKHASFNVSKCNDYEFTISSNTPQQYENLTISVTLPGDATGNVTVSNTTFTITVDVENGKAEVNISDLTPGEYTFMVTYSGDEKFDSSSKETTAKVDELVVVDTKLSSEGLVMAAGSSDTLNVTLTDADGNPLSGRIIKITLNGKTYSVTTNAIGIAALEVDLDAGNYTANAVFEGNYKYKSSKVSTNVEVTPIKSITENYDLVKDYGDSKKFTVRALDKYGNPVGSGKIVKMTVAGKTYNVKTDKNGYASLAITLAPGTYTITSEYNGYSVKNTVTVNNVLYAENMQVKKASSFTYTATLKDSNGKVIVGKTVKFIFKGKTYTATTNAKGVAKITISQPVNAGNYEIKVKYQQYTVSKRVTIVK